MTRVLAALTLTFCLAAATPDGARAEAPFSVVNEYPAGAGPNHGVVALGGRTLLVLNSDTDDVTRVDLETEQPLSPVPVGRCPLAVALSADGARAYIACFYGQSLAVVDVAAGTVVATVPLGVHPRDVAVLAGRVLLTGYYEGVLVAVAEDTLEVVDRLELAQGIHHVSAHPTNGRAYVLNTGYDTLYEVTPAPLAVARVVEAAAFGYGGAWDFAFSPDGRRAYVTQWGLDRVAAVDLDAMVIEGFCPTGGHGPCALAATPDGLLLLVAMSESDAAAVIDTRTLTLRGYVGVGRFPFSDVAVTADSRYGLVTADKDGTVDVVDLGSYERVDRLPTGRTPHVIIPGPDGTFFVSNADGASVAVVRYAGRRRALFERLYRLRRGAL